MRRQCTQGRPAIPGEATSGIARATGGRRFVHNQGECMNRVTLCSCLPAGQPHSWPVGRLAFFTGDLIGLIGGIGRRGGPQRRWSHDPPSRIPNFPEVDRSGVSINPPGRPDRRPSARLDCRRSAILPFTQRLLPTGTALMKVPGGAEDVRCPIASAQSLSAPCIAHADGPF